MDELIIRRTQDINVSAQMPAVICPTRTPVMVTATDPVTGIKTVGLADGYADGFLTREVRVIDGLTDEEQLMGLGAADATPFSINKMGAYQDAFELEVEGPRTTAAVYLVGSGSGAILPTTAQDTQLSFSQGKFCVAASGNYAQFRIIGQMTPKVVGQVRIYVRKIEGAKKP